MYSISLYTIYITNWIHTIYIILLAYFSQGEEHFALPRGPLICSVRCKVLHGPTPIGTSVPHGSGFVPDVSDVSVKK